MATMEGLQILLLLVLTQMSLTGSRPSAGSARIDGTSNCTTTNAYASFPDHSICRAASAAYPRREQELVAAVAAAAAARRNVKVAARYSHSFPELACPGGSDGAIISTRWLNRTVRVDAEKRLVTVESGMVLRDLIRAAATLPHSPYWYGLTVGGLLATGAHGSSLWGKVGAVHEYVVGLRIVTPAPASQGFATARELGTGHPDLDAAKVSLGVLGVISQVTLALQPLFKRSVSFVNRDESDLAQQVATWGDLHEFGDITNRETLPCLCTRADERLEANGSDAPRCSATRTVAARVESQAYGLTNDGVSFTGYPVVGYQHRIQASGTCLDSAEDDGLQSVCYWDSRIRGPFVYNSGFSVPLSRAPAFVADVQRLRDLNPQAFCALGVSGVLMRYVRASTAYLGKPDSIAVDIDYYRSYASGVPRAHADVIDEMEQMELLKYGGVPHWGKSRNFNFDGAIAKYPRASEFLKVKDRYDPEGIFSSEWSDQVLGIRENPSIVGKGCAIEWLCVCSEDSHSAPEKGYLCRPGKVYTEARVCAFVGDEHAGFVDVLWNVVPANAALF
ncbi:LOW QUALITY PROTEIN: hypothetical protein GQ55_6G181300 [Panicum hallii var. hallii]|uniref:FAD-binding PCMH-type domain-containing protein n=1 Tax=Panicum hallii var. hallii TaxID=1504633 RepID=A0A2T7D737_9POAL|nr:LOW QUALITY PROTEIN: hypothetical protein GQ55_6G181300 [Panicum hallii var. hallii]